ncbi:hypothetical protein V8G54_000868, partial [Vigna mungo]
RNSRDNDEIVNSNNEQVSFTPKSEFERFLINKYEKTSKKASNMKKYVTRMEKKMEEIIKNYVESSTSTEESTYENDESSEEDSMEMSESGLGYRIICFEFDRL